MQLIGCGRFCGLAIFSDGTWTKTGSGTTFQPSGGVLTMYYGGGPAFRLTGRFPLYPVSSLDAWAQSKIGPLVRSTSELHRVA
jgi:hypothetical protein